MVAQGAVHGQDFVGGECVVSTRKPAQADLVFCHWYNERTCCVPAGDQESWDQFFNLMDLGRECSYARHSIRDKYRRIREWYCLACDPSEPDYGWRVAPLHTPRAKKPSAASKAPPRRFDAAAGSPLNNVLPQSVPAGTLKWRWRVCKSFVTALWNGRGRAGEVDGKLYDQCGVKTQNSCDGGKQVVWDTSARGGYGGVKETGQPVIDGWDPYMCGDNLVVPSMFYQGPTGGEDFMRAILPPNFDDIPFDFEVVDDSVTDA
eukprot:gene6938-1854_t